MKYSRAGFTLVETLLGLVVLTLAVTIVSLSFSKLKSHQALDTSAAIVTAVLNEARSLTLSAYNDAQYGVHLEDTQVVLFRGSTYATSSTSNVVTTLHPLVGLHNISLVGSSTNIVFQRLTGTTGQAGTLDRYLREGTTTYKRINIRSTGVAEVN